MKMKTIAYLAPLVDHHVLRPRVRLHQPYRSLQQTEPGAFRKRVAFAKDFDTWLGTVCFAGERRASLPDTTLPLIGTMDRPSTKRAIGCLQLQQVGLIIRYLLRNSNLNKLSGL